MTRDTLRQLLREHLASWGLRHFTSDRHYFLWQRQALSVDELNQLNIHVERKRDGDRHDEIAFYDLAAHPKILPVLYSQRYEYYEAIAPLAAAHVGEASRILDFGCGVGILTSFYARIFPEKTFVGIDRSSASIAVAQEKAAQLGLRNLHFERWDVEVVPFRGVYDLIMTTHALLQAEQELGLPSHSWRTFERAQDPSRLASFEQRTGLACRLDRLIEVLRPNGRMILCEKTRQLARRVPFQRALASRGLGLIESPTAILYQWVEEVVEDGPFYWVEREGHEIVPWNELPERDGELTFDHESIPNPTDPDTPLYENHGASAQAAWERLADRKVIEETTREESAGRQVHVERGISHPFHYLYCANTFDQRQLVIVEEARSAMLNAYYREIVRGLS